VTKARGYQVHEFAELAGVTVRTLHHYDRLGLLRAQRNQSGFRVYTHADLERLESIIALKFIGLPLKQIRAVLGGDNLDLGCALRAQLDALEEKKRRLEAAINTVHSAEAALQSGDTPCLRQIIEVMEMQNDHEWILQHFSRGARGRVQDRLALITPATWAELQREWTALAEDIHATAHQDPAAPESQALLRRWENLIRQTTADDQELVHGLKSLYSDRDKWPERLRQAAAPLPGDRILEFLKRAVAARGSSPPGETGK
jgi:MerR family transcriptional regulator, thiopeptide resistance regulator